MSAFEDLASGREWQKRGRQQTGRSQRKKALSQPACQGFNFPTSPHSRLTSQMKRYPSRKPAHHARVPAFVPVATRTRKDGWTARRQAAFLAALAITGSVSEAARRVSMARDSAYRLRRREGAERAKAGQFRASGISGATRSRAGQRAARARKVTGFRPPFCVTLAHSSPSGGGAPQGRNGAPPSALRATTSPRGGGFAAYRHASRYA